jgi:hypothetical protein
MPCDCFLNVTHQFGTRYLLYFCATCAHGTPTTGYYCIKIEKKRMKEKL